MSEFADLASLYSHLEERAQDYHLPRDIADLFLSLGKQLAATGKILQEAAKSEIGGSNP
jgi:hypothetical protein